MNLLNLFVITNDIKFFSKIYDYSNLVKKIERFGFKINNNIQDFLNENGFVELISTDDSHIFSNNIEYYNFVNNHKIWEKILSSTSNNEYFLVINDNINLKDLEYVLKKYKYWISSFEMINLKNNLSSDLSSGVSYIIKKSAAEKLIYNCKKTIICSTEKYMFNSGHDILIKTDELISNISKVEEINKYFKEDLNISNHAVTAKKLSEKDFLEYVKMKKNKNKRRQKLINRGIDINNLPNYLL